jgi:hypothetical protein
MNKHDEFLASARSQINKGIYVWGGNGENLLTMSDPIAWIRKRETTKANANRAIELFEKRQAAGVAPIQAFDCSGLVYWSQKQANVGYGDLNANSYWKECEPVPQTEAGDLVFHHNGLKCVHVGICNGDGWVIESMGRDDGVVLTCRKSGYWNKQGRLRKLKEYYDHPDPQTVHMTGTLCLRAEGYKSAKLIGYARKGHDYPIVGRAETGWFQIVVGQKIGFISNQTKYTHLI